jgi:Ca-activated chloride channel homolog
VTRIAALVGLTLFAAVPALLLGQQPRPGGAPPPAFRSGIDIVSLNVTVADRANRYVTDLEEGDFTVFENGVRQEITVFSRRQAPIAISLLLDSSASMEHKLPVLQRAATQFVHRLRTQDLAEVIDFDGRLAVRQAFTNDKADLERGILAMSAGGSTALYNAVYFALQSLRRVNVTSDAEEEPRRLAMIVFSDGEDTSSLQTFDDLLDATKRSDTAIFTIGLREERSRRAGFPAPDFVLRQLASETGGRAFFVNRVEELDEVYGQIADELSSQYSLGYVSNNPRRDGAWRPIVVQVSKPDLTVRTKRGYFAPSR